jgi:hypothetical protein
MTSTTCTTNGVHRLPAGEQSWDDPTADLLIAAGVDGCQACDKRLSAQISRDPVNHSYGLLFTTFILATMHCLVAIGYLCEDRAPVTGLDLFPGGSREVLNPQTRRVLGEVRFPPVNQTALGVPVLSMPEGADAARVFRSMSRQDREAVLKDVLDCIVGGIVASQLFDTRSGN